MAEKKETEFSIKLKGAMDKKKVSAGNLSVKCQIPQRTIESYLYDGVQPSVKNYVKIKTYLNFEL